MNPPPTVGPSILTKARLLVLELRATEPTRYGAILARADIVPARIPTPSTIARGGAALGVLLLLVPLGALHHISKEESAWMPTYLRWRLTKPDTTTYDRFRTREEWLHTLRDVDAARAGAFLVGATSELRHGDTSAAVVDELIGLAERSPPEHIRAFWLPQLIEGLQTSNVLNRAKLHAALLGLAPEICPETPLPAELTNPINPASASPETWRKIFVAWKKWAHAASPRTAISVVDSTQKTPPL